MNQPASSHPPYATLDTVLGAIAGWVNRYRQSAGVGGEFGQCDATEINAIAKDLNVSPRELRDIAQKGPESAALLQKMLIALHVDPKALANRDPAVMRDLQRLCVSCAHKQLCAHELDVGTAPKHFHDFCPNAYTLDALFKENAAPKTDAKMQW